jgi:hypothetical protein
VQTGNEHSVFIKVVLEADCSFETSVSSSTAAAFLIHAISLE